VTARILEALPADGATIHQADLGRAAGIRAQHAAACIARLLKAGRIERVDRGLYRWPAPAAAINHAPGEWVSQVS
jgi:predicted transcriptional regulator of viral defense system